MWTVLRMACLMTLCLLAAGGCGRHGRDFNLSLDGTPGDAADLLPGDGAPGDVGFPDRVGPGDPETLSDGEGGAVDASRDGAHDAGTPPDAAPDPGEPWGPCAEDTPCRGPDQVCLLLPGSDAEGICVNPCTPGGEDCPPGETCEAPNPEAAPEVGYCFLPAGHLEPCDSSAGRVCVEGRFCLAELGKEDAVCTDFCIADEALCPDLTTCRPVDEAGVAEGWGACLPVALLDPCTGDLSCTPLETCASVDGQEPRCLTGCGNPGAPCATGGGCETLQGPGGPVTACVHRQGAGEWCDPARGWACTPPSSCLDFGDPTGFGRCAPPCDSDADCPAHAICAAAAGSGSPAAKGCIPPAWAGPPLAGCNASWPCDAADEACVQGACVPACADGCPGAQACVEGGCVIAAAAGHACAPAWGILCADGNPCLVDPDKSSGLCALSCAGGVACPPPLQCLETPWGSACATATPFGAACSFSQGLVCGEGLLCMTLGSATAGFCSAACPGIGQGGCPPGPPGTLADCMLSSRGQAWCAFLCGPFGAACPEGMSCNATGFCMP